MIDPYLILCLQKGREFSFYGQLVSIHVIEKATQVHAKVSIHGVVYYGFNTKIQGSWEHTIMTIAQDVLNRLPKSADRDNLLKKIKVIWML